MKSRKLQVPGGIFQSFSKRTSNRVGRTTAITERCWLLSLVRVKIWFLWGAKKTASSRPSHLELRKQPAVNPHVSTSEWSALHIFSRQHLSSHSERACGQDILQFRRSACSMAEMPFCRNKQSISKHLSTHDNQIEPNISFAYLLPGKQ